MLPTRAAVRPLGLGDLDVVVWELDNEVDVLEDGFDEDEGLDDDEDELFLDEEVGLEEDESPFVVIFDEEDVLIVDVFDVELNDELEAGDLVFDVELDDEDDEVVDDDDGDLDFDDEDVTDLDSEEEEDDDDCDLDLEGDDFDLGIVSLTSVLLCFLSISPSTLSRPLYMSPRMLLRSSSTPPFTLSCSICF